MNNGDEKDKTTTGEAASTGDFVISVDSAGGGNCSFRMLEAPSNDGTEVAVTPAGEVGKMDDGGRRVKRECVAVDVASGDDGRGLEETGVCRICHLNADLIGTVAEGLELIGIGCGCKGDMGTAHRRCAETWFMVKGNRLCEICGLYAINIVGKGDSVGFLEVWHEGRRQSDGQGSTDQGSRCGSQSLCSFLLSFLVIAFILQWYFRESFS